MTLSADCVGTPPAPVVRLQWTPSGAGVQRVDVWLTRDDLSGGRFSSTDELPAQTSTLEWTQAKGEAEHHWRVLTATPGGWVPSESAIFAGPGCVGADEAGRDGGRFAAAFDEVGQPGTCDARLDGGRGQVALVGAGPKARYESRPSS